MTNGDSFLLALDAGTSAVKAVLFNADGIQVATHAEEYSLEYPAPNCVELDPEIYWKAAQAAIAHVRRSAGIPPEAVAALGVTSQGETLIILDQNGRPLRKAIVWLDNRAEKEARDIAEAFKEDDAYRITGQQEIVPCWTAAKVLWVRRNEPDVFQKAAKMLLVEDYLIYRLTGRFATDHALCPSTLYYDLTAGDWWDAMLDFIGLRRNQLPELFTSGTPVGPVRDFPELGSKTLVVPAPIDQVAGALGAGNLAPGPITETTGSVMALCATCRTPSYDAKRRIGLYRHALPGLYVLLPWVPTAGMVFRWFRDALGGGLGFSELEREARGIPAGSDGLFLLPHLNGALLPDSNTAARGVFYGITLAHTRAHFVRAILESVAFLLRDLVDMLETMHIPVKSVCSLGGGARSDLWLQIKADVLNREVFTVEAQEVASLGAAILAAAGAGLYSTPQDAAKRMVRYSRRFSPNRETADIYAKSVKVYREVNRVILPTFTATQPMNRV